MGDNTFSVEDTLHVQPEGYGEAHNEVGCHSSSLPSPLVAFELRTFKFCELHAIPMS